MSIYCHYQPTSHSTLGIWEITESEEDLLLLADLSMEEKAFANTLTSHNRRMEWLATRALLKQICPKPAFIKYNPYGKPLLQGQQGFISISHTAGFAAVYIDNKEETGIDIQVKTHKTSIIRHKFLSDEELSSIGPIEEETVLLIYWCAKEALYKLYGQKELLFKENLKIQPFELSKEGECIGSISKNGLNRTYLLGYQLFEGFISVFVKEAI
jgi:4'-phosphopantetheinyl transferase